MVILGTYQQLGNREDLSEIITRVSVDKTPLYSTLGSTKATGTLHEWMTEDLDAPTFNAQVEGSTATYGTLTPRVRLNNSTQIFRKTGQVSDTQQAVLKAGVKDEYGHQLKLKTIENARDVERALWQGASSIGSASVARTSRGVLSYTSTNRQSMATAIVADTAQAGAASTITLAVGDGAATADGDHYLLTGGTGAGQYRIQVGAAAGDVITVTEAWDVVPDATSTYIHYSVPLALTADVVNDGLAAAYDAGGEPNAIYVSSAQKRAVSGFATSQRVVNDARKELTSTIDMLDTDFGRVAVKYDRWVPSGVVACLEESKYKVANLRPMMAEEMPRTGSARNFMLEGELCLESLGEEASAIIAGAAV